MTNEQMKAMAQCQTDKRWAREMYPTEEKTMREITEHVINQVNDKLRLMVVDGPGSGGAHHVYEITCEDPRVAVWQQSQIRFQNGPINEAGVNGLTHEVLLAILIDRLRCFQKGPFSTKANACALTHLEEALHWLQQRTLERMRRGVEGTHQV